MPQATHSQDTRSIAIQTPLGKDALLLRTLEGEEGLSRLFHFDLELLSAQPSVDHNLVVGRSATIGVRLPDGEDRFFNGIISRLSLVGGDGGFTVYRAELVPVPWLLTRTTDCRIFQNQSVPAIVTKVLAEIGFLDVRNRLQKVYASREYCVQYRETDFNFISRLLEQSGIFYFFEHENGKHSLVLADSSSEHPATPGLEQIRYRASQGDGYEAEIISAWSVSRELRPARYALGAYNFETPNTNLTVQVESPLAPAGSVKCEVYDYPGGYLKRTDGENVVRIRIEEQEAQAVAIRGAGTCRALASGARYDLIDHPHQELNQTYVMTAVRHSATETSYIAGQQKAGGEYRNSFAALPLTVPFRPPRITPRPLIHGVQTAVVVGKKGEEMWVDKFGRVKVQFFWDREGKRDENSSCWVRVTQNWAGKRWGAMFLPRVGQEVLVEFVDGDPDQPIITGRVYNGDQMPPYDLPAEQTKSTLKSNSAGAKGFNEWRFDDKAGAEQLFIHGQRDLDFVVERQSREFVGQEHHFIVSGGRFEQTGQEQHLKTGGDLVEEIGGERITSAKGFHVRAGNRIVIEAGGEITLKAGGGFITVGAGGVNIQGTIVNINSGGTAGTGVTKAARVPNKATSALPGESSGQGDTAPSPTSDPATDPVLLYRQAATGEMSESDKKEYEAAKKEFDAARARGDLEAMRAATAKMRAIERRNSKLAPSDQDAYEQALAELEAAKERGDTQGMKAAQAKLDAILLRNGVTPPVMPREIRQTGGSTTKPEGKIRGVGASEYGLLTNVTIDRVGFAQALNELQIRHTRVGLMNAWSWRKHPSYSGTVDGLIPIRRPALDARWDMDAWNTAYFDELRALVDLLNSYGVLPVFTAWELYSWNSERKATPVGQHLLPFQHNVNGFVWRDDNALYTIATPGDWMDRFLGKFAEAVAGTACGVETANEMPEKALHARIFDSLRRHGFAGPIQCNRHEDKPSQFANMISGVEPGIMDTRAYDAIAFHGRARMSDLDEDNDEPRQRPTTFRKMFEHAYDGPKYDVSKIVFSSDGCRQSGAPIERTYDWDQLAEVATYVLGHGSAFEHQLTTKMRWFYNGRIDVADVLNIDGPFLRKVVAAWAAKNP